MFAEFVEAVDERTNDSRASDRDEGYEGTTTAVPIHDADAKPKGVTGFIMRLVSRGR